MPIAVPPIEWPAEFTSEGPDGDGTILLAGYARIANVGFRIIALRMRKGTRLPDYREDVPHDHYEAALERMIDDVEDLIDSITPSLIVLNGAHYLLWMVPDTRTNGSCP